MNNTNRLRKPTGAPSNDEQKRRAEATTMPVGWVLFVVLAIFVPADGEDSGKLVNSLVFSCPHWNDCSGHGRCLPQDGGSRCTCDEGWGAPSDNALVKSPDW